MIIALEKIEEKTNELRESEILRYEEVEELEDIYWNAIPKGYAAIRMYLGLSGDLISNLLRALANSVDQVIKEVDYSPGKVTSVFLAKQFRKMTEVTKVSLIYVEEMKKWENIRKDEDNTPHLKLMIARALEITKKYPIILEEEMDIIDIELRKWNIENPEDVRSSPATINQSSDFGGSIKVTVSGAPSSCSFSQRIKTEISKGDKVVFTLAHSYLGNFSHWEIHIGDKEIYNNAYSLRKSEPVDSTYEVNWIADRDYSRGTEIRFGIAVWPGTATYWIIKGIIKK